MRRGCQNCQLIIRKAEEGMEICPRCGEKMKDLPHKYHETSKEERSKKEGEEHGQDES